MNWLLKSAQFQVLSLLPGGTRLYNYTQEHVTRSTIATPQRVAQKVQVGLDFWNWLQQENRAEQMTRGRVLDLGAGWHPSIPLLWYAFGNDQQTLVDVFPNMDASKVRDTVDFFRAIAHTPGWPGHPFIKRLPEGIDTGAGDVVVMLNSLGIEYRAPYGDLLKKRPGQYEIVTCTQVLQHIPKAVQLAIFQELHACLKPGGLFHATVHFVGQFRSPLLQQGQYEHLRYAPEIWEKWINSSLMSFNRLKGPDYQETLAQAGFRLREFKLTAPTEADLAELKRTRVHSCFSRYSEQDLAARGLFFVAEKP
jgi:hypothetical protein